MCLGEVRLPMKSKDHRFARIASLEIDPEPIAGSGVSSVSS
jgi:hypothetical protein